MATIGQHLRMLRDVDGVHGSFVFGATGAVVDSDLPAIFDADLLGDVGARIARLFETFSPAGATWRPASSGTPSTRFTSGRRPGASSASSRRSG